MGQASWLLALPGLAILVVGEIRWIKQGIFPRVSAYVALIVFAVGFILGLVALCSMIGYGRRGLWGPGVAGVAVNLPLFLLGAAHTFYIASLVPAKRTRLEPAIHSVGSRSIKDMRLNFGIDIPNGFIEFHEGKQTPAAAYSFIRRSQDRRTATTIIIEELDHRLTSNNRLTRARMPSSFKGQIIQRSWRGLQIDVTVETINETDGYITIAYNLQIPLRPKAIQILVVESGPNTTIDGPNGLVDILLASLEGDTDW